MSVTRIVLAAVAAFALSLPAVAQMALPSDVSPTCSVEPTTFSSWFVDGAPSIGGGVLPADSVQFPTDNTVCDFYTWGAQMFLWLTSPSGSGLVLDSSALFNVLPAVSGQSGGQRLLQHNTGDAVSFALRAGKFDDIDEIGQAGGGGVLMSQAGSLVYYGVHVNDLFGYFLTGQKAGSLSQTVFPRNADDLADVVSYVNTAFPGVTLAAPETLAMTGIHIVGTVQNHPEFVWITYEHWLNAPDAAYFYTDSSNAVVQQPYGSSGTYLFMAANGPEESANVECMKASSDGGIVAVPTSSTNSAPICSGGIVPSNTVRSYPWGSEANSLDPQVVSNNTLLLSINNSIVAQLSDGDVRGNYVQTGGIWTSAPSTLDAPIPNGFLRGSLNAFNATMETYTQGGNCFDCHSDHGNAPDSFQPFSLSHIYSQIVPLTVPGQ